MACASGASGSSIQPLLKKSPQSSACRPRTPAQPALSVQSRSLRSSQPGSSFRTGLSTRSLTTGTSLGWSRNRPSQLIRNRFSSPPRSASTHTGQKHAGTGLTQRCHGGKHDRSGDKHQDHRQPGALGRTGYPPNAPKPLVGRPEVWKKTHLPRRERLFVCVSEVRIGVVVGKGVYAQLLHDASEVRFMDSAPAPWGQPNHGAAPKGSCSLDLPVVKPNAEIPVVEIFLK